MSDDLVKRLRATCNCNIESTPCMAEEECRVAQDAADRIEALEAKLAKAAAEIEEAWKVPKSDASYGILQVMIKCALAELKGV